MPNGQIINLSALATGISRLRGAAYKPPPATISNISPTSWPSPLQPISPIGPPGSQPLGFPFWMGQNLIYTPRSDAEYTAEELRELSRYTLARVCIENTKDVICQMDWSIEPRRRLGEPPAKSLERMRQSQGDKNIAELTEMFEYPDSEHPWGEWLRPILEDLLVIDAPAILIQRSVTNKVIGLRWVPGHTITRYIDDNGFTPKPPSPAYAQLWSGMPRVDLTTDQLVYRPRNIVPRADRPGSYLYGCSPVEQVAEEIKIGMNRLAFVANYYDKGSLPNVIQVVPPNVPVDKIKETMEWMNSELAGNLAKRRQWRMVQGFQPEGKDDQIIFPKEPVLADIFDDLHIRKICFAFGTSPQRLQKPMNRGSAMQSQVAAEQENIKSFVRWVRSFANYIIQVQMGYRGYEFNIGDDRETDTVKQNKVDVNDLNNMQRPLNEIRRERGFDPIDHPWANTVGCKTAKGWFPIGYIPEEKSAEPPKKEEDPNEGE